MRKITPLVLILAACGGQKFTADRTTASAGTGGADVPAGGSAGTGDAGGGDAGDGAGGSGGNNGGLSGGDSGGSAGATSGAGSGTGGAGPTCPQLFSRAKSELDAASVCDDSAKAQQCTGTITNTCGCKVPIEKTDSVEAQAYLSTLGQIKQRNCHQNCPLIACASITSPQCNVPSGSNNHVGICANGVP